MCVDAFLILRAFRKALSTLRIVLSIFLGYIAWIEILVAKFNTQLTGRKTNGLSPFLNNMTGNESTKF